MKKMKLLGLVCLSVGALVTYQHLAEKEATLSKQEASKTTFEQAAKTNKAEEEALRLVLNDLHQEVKDYFYYNQLSKVEQAGYLRLLHSLRQFDPDAYLNNHDGFAQGRIFLALAYDHPEFYWLSETKYDINYMDIAYPKDAKAVYQQLQAIGDEVISKMPEGSDYDKVKYIYEYIIQNTEYNLAALDNEELAWANQSIRSVFLEKKSICNGYSLAFQFLCQKAGIQSLYVAGDISESNLAHAWNLVQIDGKYYAVDTTWGDPTFAGVVGEGGQPMTIDYAYLAMPKAIFEKSHFPWTSFYDIKEDSFTYPEIEGADLSHYYLTGAYFETYQPEQLGQFLASKLQSNRSTTLQIGTSTEYDRLAAGLTSDQGTYLHSYLEHLPSYAGYDYVLTPSTQTVTFNLLNP